MADTARLTKQQLRQRRDATRDRSRDNTKGTVQYLVTYAYTNNCLLCASNINVSVAIPTLSLFENFFKFPSGCHAESASELLKRCFTNSQIRFDTLMKGLETKQRKTIIITALAY